MSSARKVRKYERAGLSARKKTIAAIAISSAATAFCLGDWRTGRSRASRKRILGSQKHSIDILGGHLAQRILAPPPMPSSAPWKRTERNKNREIRRKRRAHQTCNSDAPVVNYLAGGERDRGEADERHGQSARNEERCRGETAGEETRREGNRARHGVVKRERVEGPRSSGLIKNSG